jgi:ribonuclease HII
VTSIRRLRPDFAHEIRLGGRVAGLDEVGRGPLAGPVVAACVVLPSDLGADTAALLNDSKKLSPAAREAAFRALIEAGAEIGLGAASVLEILNLNILHASLLAMRRAFTRLRIPPDAALVDGNRPPNLPCPTHCLVGGDAKSLSIAAASIVAKVTRDRAMEKLDTRYPHYGWAQNAGYGTPIHLTALTTHGPTKHHRTNFGTVRRLLEVG